jgi:hypothetical protein
MKQKMIGVIGLLISMLFLIGFFLLFIHNPQTLAEMDNIPSIASYNLQGMKGSWIAAYINYLAVGLLNFVFGIGLLISSRNDFPMVVGKTLVLVAGLLWASFGLIVWDPNSDIGIHTIMLRVLALLLIVPLGLIFLGVEFERIIKDKFSKYYTLITGLIILVLGVLSLFVFNDQSWIRTNFSITLYFLWFGVIGLRWVNINRSHPIKPY